MRKFLSKLWHNNRDIWIPLLTAIVIAAIGIAIALTNHVNPISIWLKEFYGVSPP